jgi:hypothetical protein
LHITEGKPWLLAFDLWKGTVFLNDELVSAEKIFVRNNSRYLYYGIHSEEWGDSTHMTFGHQNQSFAVEYGKFKVIA